MFNGNSIKFYHDCWLSTLNSIRSYVLGPLLEQEDNFTIADLLTNGTWQLDKLSLTLPRYLVDIILDHPMNLGSGRGDKRIWNLTNDGRFTYTSSYNHIVTQND